ncbi:hypothetical protein BEI60_17970 [Eisenbergiella tayi]|nr:hypothetical protein BEI60_17970 [Eisenbergiella tayi]
MRHVYENNIFHYFVYAFHMPLFFMAAGWLYKEKPIIPCLRRRFFTVMIPCLQSFIGLLRGEYYYLDFNEYLQFLPFLTVVIYNGLKNVAEKKWTYNIAVSMSAMYVVDIYSSWSLPSLPWRLNRVCSI